MQPIINYETYTKKFTDLQKQKVKQTTLIRVFLDTPLSNGHDGLRRLAIKEGVDVTNLNLGEFVIFINKQKSALKLFAPANILVHLKMPGANKLNMRAIRFIPRVFNAKEMTVNYDQALSFALAEEFKIKERQKQ